MVERHREQKIEVIPLYNLYNNSDKDSVLRLQEFLYSFSCPYGRADIDEFLHDRAIDFDNRNLCRTYLIIEIKSKTLVGYYSIGIKTVELGEINKSQKQKLTSGKMNLTHIATFILAQVGKNKNCNYNLKKGEIIKLALQTVKDAQLIVGGRVVYLDCKPILVKYYSDNGFRVLHENNDNVQMVLSI